MLHPFRAFRVCSVPRIASCKLPQLSIIAVFFALSLTRAVAESGPTGHDQGQIVFGLDTATGAQNLYYLYTHPTTPGITYVFNLQSSGQDSQTEAEDIEFDDQILLPEGAFEIKNPSPTDQVAAVDALEKKENIGHLDSLKDRVQDALSKDPGFSSVTNLPQVLADTRSAIELLRRWDPELIASLKALDLGHLAAEDLSAIRIFHSLPKNAPISGLHLHDFLFSKSRSQSGKLSKNSLGAQAFWSNLRGLYADSSTRQIHRWDLAIESLKNLKSIEP